MIYPQSNYQWFRLTQLFPFIILVLLMSSSNWFAYIQMFGQDRGTPAVANWWYLTRLTLSGDASVLIQRGQGLAFQDGPSLVSQVPAVSLLLVSVCNGTDRLNDNAMECTQNNIQWLGLVQTFPQTIFVPFNCQTESTRAYVVQAVCVTHQWTSCTLCLFWET